MKKKSVQLAIVVISIFCIVCIEFVQFTTVIQDNNKQNDNIIIDNKTNHMSGCIDITVEEAWYLLSNTSNGIQLPIDVRTDEEWENDFIKSQPPEYPRHHCLYDWDNISILNDFIKKYDQQELVLYCKSGGRSRYAAQLLVENGFNGTVYNMLGGIIAWKTKGFPVRNNTKPETPIITGPSRAKISTEIEFSVVTTDKENDDIQYIINWSDENEKVCIGPYHSGDNIYFYNNWSEKGQYTVDICAIDIYGKESECTTLKIRMEKNYNNRYLELIFEMLTVLFEFYSNQAT